MNVSDLAGKLRDLRFDGYTDTGIATEIERFRSGDGTGSISTAVDALKSVATALADTDKTLRDQLGKLGVEWQSDAGGAAGQVFTEQAGFSQDANTKVTHSAEMIFSQGEAFNRTLHKLPDPETVRKGAGGYTVGDVLLSLIGFETDHAKSVSAAANARAQAQEALNDYAKQSGENLLATDTLADPQSLQLTQTTSAAGTSGGSGALNLAGTATDLTPDGSVKPASAAVESKYVPPPVAQPISHPKAPSYDAPTPAYGVGVGGSGASRQTGSAAPQGGTTPASAAPTAPSGTPRPNPAPGGGWVHTPGPNRPAPQPEPGRPSTPAGGPPGSQPFVPPGAPHVPPGQATGTAPPSSSAPGKTFGPGPGVDGAIGKHPGSSSGTGVIGGLGGGQGGGDQALGKGRVVGSGPQAPLSAGNESGRIFPAVPKVGPAAGDLGAGAAALGAGVAGGALSGERERDRKARAEGSGKPTRQLPIGELPEEEAMRRSEKIGAKQPKTEPKFMEPAATQDVEEDAEHIRRYGVDDKDLFTDERMVSPDVIGEHGTREAR